MNELLNFCHITLIKTTFEDVAKSKRIKNYALNPIFYLHYNKIY